LQVVGGGVTVVVASVEPDEDLAALENELLELQLEAARGGSVSAGQFLLRRLWETP
jgi:hypothetical protein